MNLKPTDTMQSGDIIYYKKHRRIVVNRLAGKKVCELPGVDKGQARVVRPGYRILMKKLVSFLERKNEFHT